MTQIVALSVALLAGLAGYYVGQSSNQGRHGKYSRAVPVGAATTTPKPPSPTPADKADMQMDAVFESRPDPEHDNMAIVTVTVWDFVDGKKVPRHMEVVVNKTLSKEVQAILREIFEDQERFPIHELLGYEYRTVANGKKLSDHAFGRAIDINRAENPCIRNGKPYVDPNEAPYKPKAYRPGEDPYSIPPDGSVVKAFKRRGWKWGGDWHTLKDWQHFYKPR